MKEKETYRDNLEQILKFCGRKNVLSITRAAEYLGCDPKILQKEKRFMDLTFPLGTQRRISAVNLARYIS